MKTFNIAKLVPALLVVWALAGRAQETALDRYVAAPDAVYGWKLVNTASGEGYKAFVLELTSQSWRTAAEVDRPVWKHWLTIVKPEKAASGTAMLFIGAGSNNDPAPTAANARTVSFALESNTVVADLGMVPNQPLVFADSKDKRRSEDDLIAYTRVKHFSTKDDTWLVRLAMVKSGVRAMDAVQAFLASDAGGRLTIDRFVVSGGSKRGWTTWLVGAVDPRVIAIMPTVIDALNSELITRHHFEAMGFFSSALDDYVNHGLFPHWTKEKDGSLRVTTMDPPRTVTAWQATNPKARDFRVDTIGNAYAPRPLTEHAPGVYVASVPKPDQGFTAFFVELVYDSGGTHPFKFTTEVSVVPDTLPFRWEDAKAKYPAR